MLCSYLLQTQVAPYGFTRLNANLECRPYWITRGRGVNDYQANFARSWDPKYRTIYTSAGSEHTYHREEACRFALILRAYAAVSDRSASNLGLASGAELMLMPCSSMCLGSTTASPFAAFDLSTTRSFTTAARTMATCRRPSGVASRHVELLRRISTS